MNDSATQLLSYSIFATNDMLETIGGNPYDNRTTWYRGSCCDWCLNRGVDRFEADPGAIEEIMRFAPTGEIEAPLVTLHTTCDPLVPFWVEDVNTDNLPAWVTTFESQMDVEVAEP